MCSCACVAAYNACALLDGVKRQKYLGGEVDHLKQVGRGLLLVGLHPNPPHHLRRLDSLEHFELQQRLLPGYLDGVELWKQ